MNSKLKVILFLLISLTLCKKSDWREELQPVDWKVLHKDLVQKQTINFQMTGGFETKEDLLNQWFQAIQKNPKGDWTPFLLTEEEYKEYFLPHTLGLGTSLDATPMETYWPLFVQRRSMGLERIVETVSHSNGKIKSISWREGVRNFGPWSGYKPDSIEIEINGKPKKIEEIKQIVSFQGKFKVAVIAP